MLTVCAQATSRSRNWVFMISSVADMEISCIMTMVIILLNSNLQSSPLPWNQIVAALTANVANCLTSRLNPGALLSEEHISSTKESYDLSTVAQSCDFKWGGPSYKTH